MVYTRHQTLLNQQQARGTRRLQWAMDEQAEAFAYGPAPLCLNGGFGGGKTICTTRKILYLSSLFPGNRGVVARRVGDELRKTTMVTFFKDCPPEAYMYGGRRADQEKILRLNPVKCEDGIIRSSEILFLHLDDPNIQHILRGLEINWFLLDQAEEMEEENFDTLLRRLGRWDQAFVPQWLLNQERAQGREWAWWNTPDGLPHPGAKPIPPIYPMITVNPDLETHWVWRRFHEESPEWQEKWRAFGYKMITFNPLHNKFLSKQNRDQLMSADPVWIDKYVYGKWGSSEAQIHKIPDESIITPDSPEAYEGILNHIRNTCTLHRVMDHGDSSPTCVLWYATDDDGNCICYREYYKGRTLISEHRQNVHSLSLMGETGRMEPYTFNIGDPSIHNKTMQKKEGWYSVADEWTDTANGQLPETAIFWAKGNNDEFGTRNRINEYLKVDPNHIHPFTKKMGSPRIFFLKRHPEFYHFGCEHAIRELRAQRREKTGSENGRDVYSDERDPKVPDHGYDPTRYFIASRPPLFTAQRKVALHGTMLEARMKLKRHLKTDRRWQEVLRAQEDYIRQKLHGRIEDLSAQFGSQE